MHVMITTSAATERLRKSPSGLFGYLAIHDGSHVRASAHQAFTAVLLDLAQIEFFGEYRFIATSSIRANLFLALSLLRGDSQSTWIFQVVIVVGSGCFVLIQ